MSSCKARCNSYYRLGIVPETGTPPTTTGQDTGIKGLASMNTIRRRHAPRGGVGRPIEICFNQYI